MVNIPLSVYQLRPILTRAASTTSNPWRRRKLNSENRFQKFVALYNFVSPRLGFRPAIKTPQIRNSAWMHLIALATNEEQLRQVTELFPGWNDLRREFGPEVSEAFVRRCEELTCPHLALHVFGDHSKYALSLSLPAARHLLHSLHAKRPVQDTISASALYRVYGLPPVSADLISCALLASACFKAAMRGAGPEFSLKNGESAEETRGKAAQEAAKVVQENAETVGWSLVPHLKTLLKTTRPPHDGTKTKAVQASSSRNEAREQVWVKWTLAKIEKALQLKGEDIGWLRTWRRSGHVTNGI